MNRKLVVTDMQNDFITGTLGSAEAVAIVPRVKKKIQEFDGEVFFLQDTHEENYLDTPEGKKLLMKHCIRGTQGWQLAPEIEEMRKQAPLEKCTFGSAALGEILRERETREGNIDEVVVVGLCTDICVISNALLVKAFLPNAKITVDAACCAGVTQESHENALKAMRACQIEIE